MGQDVLRRPPAQPDIPQEDALLTCRLARRSAAAGLALLALPTFAACQNSEAGSAFERIKRAGRIVIATDALYPPNEFKQGGRIVGLDVDLGTAVAGRLGVRAEFQDVKFATILTALKDGKYDVSLSSFTDTKEREAAYDFVTYLSAGTMLMVRRGNPKRLRPDDLSLCGRRVAVEKGTTQEDGLIPRNAAKPHAGARVDACLHGHRPRPVRLAYDDQAAAGRALARGRADAVLADSPTVLYDVRRSGGRFEVSGGASSMGLYGIVIPKNQTDLRDAVHKALKELFSDGTYRKILDRWGLAGGAVPEPRINPAG